MISLLEIAVYAVIVSGSSELTCFGREHEQIACTNGLSAEVQAPATVVFSNGIKVDPNGGFPVFSNGTKSWLDSAGWVYFTTGIEVRRVTPDYFKFSSGLECRTKLPNLVQCAFPGKAAKH